MTDTAPAGPATERTPAQIQEHKDWMSLHAMGARFVRCDQEKKPLDPKWQDADVGIQAVLAHRENGGLVGVVPGSLGWWVIDQDKGSPDTICEQIPQVAFSLPTRSPGHAHHWLRRRIDKQGSVSIGNKKWSVQDCSGDLRGDKGFVVVWDLRELVDMITFHKTASRADPWDFEEFKCRAPVGSKSQIKRKGPEGFNKARITSGAATDLQPPDEHRRVSKFALGLVQQVRKAADGERNNVLNTAVYRAYAKNLGGATFDDKVYDAAIASGLADEEIVATMASAKQAGVLEYLHGDDEPAKASTLQSNGANGALEQALAAASQDPAEGDTTSTRSLSQVYKGTTYAHIEQAVQDLGYKFRFNTLTSRVEAWVNDGPWVDISNSTATIRYRIETECGVENKTGVSAFRVTKERFDDLMRRYAEDASMAKNPLIEWVRSLPKWDGKDRMGTVLNQTLGANPTSLNAWAGMYLFTSVLIRNATLGGEGHSLDQMLFLIGPQGIGKSKFVLESLPKEVRSKWVSTHFSMNWDSKTKAEHVVGKVFAEVPEINFDRFFSLDDLKAFLSAAHDEVRMPYRPRTEVFARTATFVATLNHANGLPDDPTGNRRFVPVKCLGIPSVGPGTGGGFAVKEWWGDNRDQLWAQAWYVAQRVIIGEATMEMHAQAQNELHAGYEDTRQIDEELDGQLELAIRRTLQNTHSEYVGSQHPNPPGFRFSELLVQLGGQDSKRSFNLHKRVQGELRRAGWEPRRTRINMPGGEVRQERRWLTQAEIGALCGAIPGVPEC